MRPGMRIWLPGEPILIRDERYAEYLRAKQSEYEPVFGSNPDLSLLRRAIGVLKECDPSCVIDIDHVDLVHGLTMSMQEDWVLLGPNQRGDLSAQILSVHFPSGWDPRTRAGMTFSELHEPVADNRLIMKAADSLGAMISSRGPFIRHVWSVVNTESLSRRPDRIPPISSPNIASLWYRCERQTTIPIDGKGALFLIRVYVAPLQTIFEDAGKKRAIIDSINSMSEAVLDYKGCRLIKQLLV